MRIELTQQSGLEVNQLSAADMTPAMAAQYLSGTIHLRSFWRCCGDTIPLAICGIG